jgi:DNA invertase Pin-like site-specific DNA recombinase
VTVWVEGVDDHGSAVWGCEHCRHGGWCPDRVDALAEAERHARAHGIPTVAVVDRRHGPKPVASRDERIRTMLKQGLTVRAIAAAVGLSTAGVIKARRRIEARR